MTSDSSSSIVTSCRRPSRPVRLAAAILVVAATVIAVVALSSSFFTWNLSPSVPRGVYLLRHDLTPRRGDIVLLSVPGAVLPLVRARHYLPPGVHLLKIVLALPNDDVCTTNSVLTIEGRAVATIRRADSQSRPLEPFQFCGNLTAGVAFVGTVAPLSFDSRYFGPVPIASLVVAQPLWTF